MGPGTIALHVGHMPEKVSKLVGMRINRTVAYFLCAYLGENIGSNQNRWAKATTRMIRRIGKQTRKVEDSFGERQVGRSTASGGNQTWMSGRLARVTGCGSGF